MISDEDALNKNNFCFESLWFQQTSGNFNDKLTQFLCLFKFFAYADMSAQSDSLNQYALLHLPLITDFDVVICHITQKNISEA